MLLQNREYDFVIAGGGLQAGLLALAIHNHQTDARVLIVEENDRLFGNHTWSFHGSDVPESVTWLKAVSYQHWPAYKVKFPSYEKRINLGYCSFSSAQLNAAVEAVALQGNLDIQTGDSVEAISADSLQTASGATFTGKVIVDCRGARRDHSSIRCGFQKFHGFEVELEQQEWPDRLPILMDATVDQQDGFRFLYVLPLTSRRVLIEDTYFSETPTLDRQNSLSEVKNYLAERSIENWTLVREENGCLPMPFNSSMKPNATAPIRGGFRGGWFHAATGYSLPLAVRFAETIATSSPKKIDQQISLLATQNRFQATFSRFLNRLLFQLVSPRKRFEIFRRFYRALPDTTIERFYAHEFTKLDAARILIGAPPRGLTPVRFLNSFRVQPCPVLQS